LASLPLISVCIPAHDEERVVGPTIVRLSETLLKAGVPHEFVVAEDNSSDGTADAVRATMARGIPIRMVRRRPPGGFGRAVRSALEHARGDYVVVVMADGSDDPNDVVRYYEKLREGYDAVFGSRFLEGSVVSDYPKGKLIANRLGNLLIRLLFRTRHNDVTNAFKAYRAEVVRGLAPLWSSHFNLTIEIALGALIRGRKIAAIPINWYGRTWGRSHFRIRELGRRYFATLLKVLAERVFIRDDVTAEYAINVARSDPNRDADEIITNIEEAAHPRHGGRGVRGIKPGDSVREREAGA
jgi:dolichol-phosphate mannosyltransferase